MHSILLLNELLWITIRRSQQRVHYLLNLTNPCGHLFLTKYGQSAVMVNRSFFFSLILFFFLKGDNYQMKVDPRSYERDYMQLRKEA